MNAIYRIYEENFLIKEYVEELLADVCGGDEWQTLKMIALLGL